MKIPSWLWGGVVVFVVGALVAHLGWLSYSQGQREKLRAWRDSTATVYAADTARANLETRQAREVTERTLQAADSLRRFLAAQRVTASNARRESARAREVLSGAISTADSLEKAIAVIAADNHTIPALEAENATLRQTVKADSAALAAFARLVVTQDTEIAVRDKRLAGLDSALRVSTSVQPNKKFLGFLPKPSRVVVFAIGAAAGFLISKRGGM